MKLYIIFICLIALNVVALQKDEHREAQNILGSPALFNDSLEDALDQIFFDESQSFELLAIWPKKQHTDHTK